MPDQPRNEAFRDLAERVLAGVDELVPRMGEAYREAIPAYAALDDALYAAEVLPTSRRAVVDFCDRVIAGLTMADLDDNAFRIAGRRRLEMGVTLEDSLHAFRLAARVVWDEMVNAAGPSNGALVAELAGAWLEYIDRIATGFAEGHTSASHDQLRRLDAQRREIVDSLLAVDAADAASVAARYGITLAKRYVPVLLAGPDVSARVEAVASSLDEAGLVGSRGRHLLALVPQDQIAADSLRLTSHAEYAIVGEPAEVGATLRDEVASLVSLLHAATESGHKGGVLRMDDLLVPFIARDRDRVVNALRRRILGPLEAEDRDGVFAETLAAFLTTGSVPNTATGLHVHANTVLYRLRRVQEITALDPRVPADAALLLLALEARSTGDDQ